MNIISFGKNTLLYAIGIIIIRLTTFLLIPLYTHYLSKEQYGLLATLLFTTEIIITINDIGMRSAFMRFFSDFINKNKLGELIGSTVILNLLIGLLLFIVALIIPDSYIAKLFDIDLIKNVVVFTVLAGTAKTLTLNIISYFRAKNRGGAYMAISVLSSLLLIAVTWFALVVKDLGIMGVLYSQVFTFGLVWLALLLWIINKEGFKTSLNSLSMLLRFGYPLIMATSGGILVNTAGNYFLGYFRNLEEVALFAIAYKIASISVMVLIAPFQLAFEPYIFNNKDNPAIKSILTKIITYITFLYLVVSIGILIIFKYLVQILGSSDYTNSYALIFLLLPGFLFTAYNYIGQSLIHINNKTKTTGLTSFFIVIASIILTYFLTSSYGTYGAIFGVNFYLIATGIILFLLGNKEFPLKIEYKRVMIIFTLGIFLFISIYYLSFSNDFFFYFLSIFLSIIFLIGLFISNFFSEEEKKVIKSWILIINNKFKVRA